MHVSDAKRFLKLIAEKQIPVTPLFVGAMGIGKSEIVKQVATELNIGFIDLRLAQMEPGDLIGIPYRDGDRTKWAAPDWFPKEGTRGIVHYDEINRAPNDVRQSSFQLVWDRCLHTHKLPVGWTQVASMNPDNSNAGYQVETLDPAYIRRFCVLSLEPNVDTWMKWAMSAGNISPDIVGFIGTHKNMLFESESFEMPVKRNNAAWSVINTLREAGAIPSDLEFEIIAGIVGKEAAVAWRKYQDEHYLKPVNGEDVLKDYSSVKERVLKQVKKADEMYVTIKEIIAFSEAAKTLGKKQKENLVKFLLDIPADMQVMLMSELPPNIVSVLAEEDKRVLAVGRASLQARENKKDA